MLYTLPAFCFLSHLNNTPKSDSVQEPGFVIFRSCLLVRQPLIGIYNYVGHIHAAHVIVELKREGGKSISEGVKG